MPAKSDVNPNTNLVLYERQFIHSLIKICSKRSPTFVEYVFGSFIKHLCFDGAANQQNGILVYSKRYFL